LVEVVKVGGFTVNLDALADYVKAKIKTVGPAPRIPPFRLLGGVEAFVREPPYLRCPAIAPPRARPDHECPSPWFSGGPFLGRLGNVA
jgi:hypothetical protein